MTERKQISRLAWQITFVLFFAILFFDFADQSILGPLLNPLLLDFFNNTDNVVPLGWLTFFFTVFSAISMIVAGILADKKSRKKICFIGCLIYSAFSILTILIPHGETGYIFFFITRSLNGIGIGAVVPTIYSMVGDGVSPKRRTISFAYIALAILLGRMAGLMIAGANAHQWRVAYLLLGLINLALAMGLLCVREPKRGIQEMELRKSILEGAEYRFRISRKDIRFIWSNKSNFWLVLNFVDVLPGSIILFLIFKYVKDIHNLPTSVVNVVVVIVVIFGGIGTLVFGKLGDWGFQKDKRAKVIIALFCNIVPIVFMLGFLLTDFWIKDGTSLSEALTVPSLWIFILMIGSAMFINQGVNPNWYSTLTDVNLPEHRATMISLASFMDIVGSALGPLIGSYLATIWGIRTAMWSVLGFWLLNTFFWLPVFSHIRKDLSRIHRCLSQRAAELEKK
jgi:MFS family permease